MAYRGNNILHRGLTVTLKAKKQFIITCDYQFNPQTA
jgi:hypothetical protein